MTVYKPKAQIPTIDCEMVTVSYTSGSSTREMGFDTANQVEVEVQVEEEDAVKLVIKGKLKAQKPKQSTITGHDITLHDNVFNPELVTILQGGTISYGTGADANKVTGYTPPLVGSGDDGEEFTLNVYSAQYNAAGQIVNYEKIQYPHCVGDPVAFNAEDGTFRAPEYVIHSAPNEGEAPYIITYVDALPTLTDPA